MNIRDAYNEWSHTYDSDPNATRDLDRMAIERVFGELHHITDFLRSAEGSGFALNKLQEWWHEKDAGKPPRLVSFLFEKAAQKDIQPFTFDQLTLQTKERGLPPR